MVNIEFIDTKGAVWGLNTVLQRIINIKGHVKSPINAYPVICPGTIRNGTKLEVLFPIKSATSAYRKELLVVKDIIGVVI